MITILTSVYLGLFFFPKYQWQLSTKNTITWHVNITADCIVQNSLDHLINNEKNGIDDNDVSATEGLATKNLTIGSSSSYSRGRFLTFKNILVQTT